MPSSPSLLQINAPLPVDRGKLNDTANFLLPPSRITNGKVTSHAEASDYNGHNIASAPQLLTFQRKAVPGCWIIQETWPAPILAAIDSVNLQGQYHE